MSESQTLIRGARLVDGTGNPWIFGDVLIQGSLIAGIEPPGSIPDNGNAEVVDASGLVVCPGFIDIQSHSIVPFLRDRRSLSKVTQGVTTEIMGELWTPVPFGGRRRGQFGSIFSDEENEMIRQWTTFSHWMDWLSDSGVSVNFGSFVGGATIREFAKGWDQGDPTAAELDVMRGALCEAMQEGSFGIATALIYPPNSYSPDSELLEMAKVVARYGGVYITHIRDEGNRLLESLQEAIELGRLSNAPIEIYHLKATGERNWPKIPSAIEMIDKARAEGVDITCDMYPYVGSGTGLNTLIPDWVSEGGNLYQALSDHDIRRRAHKEMIDPDPGVQLESNYSNTRDHVMPIGFRKEENRPYIGIRLTEIARIRGTDWADTAIDLLLSEEQRISTIFFSMCEENVRLQLGQPWIKISTDAGGIDPAQQENPIHPRAYGTYPRVLGKYVRDEKALSLEEAVRKMSSAVAFRLGLRNRGLLLPGYFADVVVFDPETIADHATFTDPHHLSTGVNDVWVNGVRVLRGGVHTNAIPGAAVYGPYRS